MVLEIHLIAKTMGRINYGKAGWIMLSVALLLVLGVGFATAGRHVNASDAGVVSVGR